MNSKKVIVFSLRSGWAGAEMMALELARAYVELGFTVHYYYIFGPKPEVVDGLVTRRLNSWFLWGLDKGDERGLLAKIYLQLIDILNIFETLVLVVLMRIISGKVDVIHFNKIRGCGGFVFLWAKLILAGKVYYTAHDYEFFSPNAKKSMRYSKLGYIYRLFKSPFLHFVDIFYCPSRYVCDAFESCFSYENKSRLLENFSFSDGEVYSERKYSGGIFGFLGRLEKIKGVDLLCEGFIESDAKGLIIAGEGSLRDNVQRYVDMDGRISYVGLIDAKGKSNFFKSIDYLVVPSIWEEVYGLVVQEAFSYGVPVIASNQGALPELIKNHELIIDLDELKDSNMLALKLNWFVYRAQSDYDFDVDSTVLAGCRTFSDFHLDLERVS